MKTAESEIITNAIKSLKDCFQRVTFLKVESIRKNVRLGEMEFDIFVRVQIENNKQDIIAEVKGNGQPRIARMAVNQLLRYRERNPNAYFIFAAPYISPQSAEICAREEIGYIDFAGNCRLSFDRVYIQQEGKANPLTVKRDLRSLYSPKAERVLRVILNNPKQFWRLQSLAREAKVSLGQASNVKNLLANREWLTRTEAGLALNAPEQLLAEWSENYKFTRSTTRNFYTLKKPADIESDIAEFCRTQNLNYALTGFSAAARYAPAVRYQRAMIYFEDKVDMVARHLSLKEVGSGANVTLINPYDEGVFYGSQPIDGIRLAIPIQVYLDLMSMKARGEEAAVTLLDEVIKKSW